MESLKMLILGECEECTNGDGPANYSSAGITHIAVNGN